MALAHNWTYVLAKQSKVVKLFEQFVASWSISFLFALKMKFLHCELRLEESLMILPSNHPKSMIPSKKKEIWLQIAIQRMLEKCRCFCLLWCHKWNQAQLIYLQSNASRCLLIFTICILYLMPYMRYLSMKNTSWLLGYQ